MSVSSRFIVDRPVCLCQDELVNESQKTDPRTRILEVAERLFYSEGVRATGTEKIMSVSDVAKATFYRHFESKDALVLAYLDRSAQAFWDYLSSPTPPEDVHEALVKIDPIFLITF